MSKACTACLTMWKKISRMESCTRPVTRCLTEILLASNVDQMTTHCARLKEPPASVQLPGGAEDPSAEN